MLCSAPCAPNPPQPYKLTFLTYHYTHKSFDTTIRVARGGERSSFSNSVCGQSTKKPLISAMVCFTSGSK